MSQVKRQRVRDELVHCFKTTTLGRHIIRMGQETFENFCEILQRDGGLIPSKFATVEEQVVKFLYTLALGVSNCEMALSFRRSGETISCHFHSVLRAVISLEDKYLQLPDGSQVPQEILDDERVYLYFKVTKIYKSLI